MMITIIPESYRKVYQLVLKIFECALLSPTYSLHNLLWKLEIQSISEALYLRTEFENDMFLFGKIIFKLRSLFYKNLKRLHHKFSTCRSTLIRFIWDHYYDFSVFSCNVTDAFSSAACIRKSGQKWLKFVHKFEKSSQKILALTRKMDLESRIRTEKEPIKIIYKNW